MGTEEMRSAIKKIEPQHAELIAQDLDNAGMSLAECEKKIKAKSDDIHRKLHGSGTYEAIPVYIEGQYFSTTYFNFG